MLSIKSIKDNIRYTDRVFDNLTYEGRSITPDQFPDQTPYILSDREELKKHEEKLGRFMHNLDSLSDDEINHGVFYIYYTYDSDALPMLKRISRCGGKFIPPLPTMVNKTEYTYGVNRLAHEALIKTTERSRDVSHLRLDVHQNICEALDATKNLDGDYLEIGVYKGGSALTALNYIDLQTANGGKPRCAFLLDTFTGFDYSQAQESTDIMWKNSHALYGLEGTQQHITRVLADIESQVFIHPSNICEHPLPEQIEKLVVVNIDVDMYEATLFALQKVSPHVVVGGIIICEDPASTPALYGAYLAMEEFLDCPEGKKYVKIFKGGQYFLVKTQ